MSSTQFSVRLPDHQKEFLDSLAEASDRTRNQLIVSAVGKMIENYQFVLEKVERGEADLAAGRVFTTDEVAKRTQAVLDRLSQTIS
jgi:predicted transcriptional regulator